MHHMITDEPFKFAREKAYEFLKDGRSVMVVVPNAMCRTYFKSSRISCGAMSCEGANGVKSFMYIRTVAGSHSLSWMPTYRLIMIGDIPRDIKALACVRVCGHPQDQEIWHVQGYDKVFFPTSHSIGYNEHVESVHMFRKKGTSCEGDCND
jgi:hypothetical protein